MTTTQRETGVFIYERITLPSSGGLSRVMAEDQIRSKISVLVVDDSAFMRAALSRMIASDPDLVVVGTAASGAEGLARIAFFNPDVVILDLQMPGLGGIETLHSIMAEFPRPVIIVSSTSLRDAEITFEALAVGAFDYVPKQLSSTSLDISHIHEDLISKIKAAAHFRQSRTVLRTERKPPRMAGSVAPETRFATPMIVAIGTSTGGPKALQEILPLLPTDLSVPILVVQHMPQGFAASFAQRLNALCAVSVREASHHELIQPGAVYIAPAGTHMTVARTTDSEVVICLTPERENDRHTQAVDLMMDSVASTFRDRSMGVIMTGMGSDGAQGMKAIHREGGLTVGQDEASCTVYGMPRVCAQLGILKRVVPLGQIPQEILYATLYRKRAFNPVI